MDAAHQRVLFLAEKQAALAVVKRRLDRSGVGDFRLELHSDKSSSKVVVESLKQRAGLGRASGSRQPAVADFAWQESRREIKKYIDALHSVDSDGSTPFDLIWKSIRGQSSHPKIIGAFKAVGFPAEILADPTLVAEISARLAHLAATAASYMEAFGHPARSAWAAVALGDFQRFDSPALIELLSELEPIVTELAALTSRYPLGAATVEEVEDLIALDQILAAPPNEQLVAAPTQRRTRTSC